MKIALLLLLAFSFISASCSMQNRVVTAENQTISDEGKAPKNLTKAPVLVELFTSEGCSSCPPADRALAFLEKEQPVGQAEIIALALHVDYWNRLGWTDELSSPLFSQRQEIYAGKFRLDSVYTPQMVVDGSEQFTGSDLGKATKFIMEAAKDKKANIELSLNSENKLNIKISEIPASSAPATVFLALAESGLSSNIKSGENSGKVLEHTAVVRELKSVGALDLQKKFFAAEIALSVQPHWKRENLKAVIFIQQNQNRKIIGVNQILFGQKMKNLL